MKKMASNKKNQNGRKKIIRQIAWDKGDLANIEESKNMKHKKKRITRS